MPLTFNTLLRAADIDPANVRLLRHRDDQGASRTLWDLWTNNRATFEAYQARQQKSSRPRLAAPIWASFVVTPTNETIFAGLYAVGSRRSLPADMPKHNGPGIDTAALHEEYETNLLPALLDLSARLHIDWGPGLRTWVQRADLQDKTVLEIRRVDAEPPFPGYLNLTSRLSDIATMPPSWRHALSLARGIYLLVCPESREQYVGQAAGSDGFLGRWLSYVATGHGGNVGMLSRPPTDYRVSILEVAGSGTTAGDMTRMEDLWKQKLLSREMGLNRN